MEPSRLDALVEVVTEKVTTRKDPERPYVGLEHMATGSPDLVGTAPSSSSVSTNSVFAVGDTLYGKLRPNLRKAVIAQFDGYCSTDILVLRAREDVAPSYAGRLFQSEIVSATAIQTAIGTKMPRTSWSALKGLLVHKPPPSEQRRIAEILDTLDEAIRKTEQLIAKLKQVKQGLLHDLLTLGIDDNGEPRDPDRHPEQFKDSPLGLLPTTWRNGVLANFIEGSPQNGLYKPASFYADEGTPIVRIDSFYDGTIDDISRLKRVRLTEQERGLYGIGVGDLLINRVNSIEYVGKAAIMVNAPDAMVFESNIMRLRVRGADVLPEYAIQVLCSPPCRAYFQVRAKPAIAQVSVNQDDVKEVPFSVPSLAEQAGIVTRIQAIAQSIDSEQTGLSKLRLLKSGLMEDLLTGQIRVTNLLSEAAT